MFLVVVSRGAFAFLLSLLWEGARLLNGADWSWEAVGWRLGLAWVALCLSAWAASRRARWFLLVGLVLPLCLVASWHGLRQTDTLVAWFAVTGLFTLLLALASAFASWTQERTSKLARLEYGVGLLALSVVGGVVPVSVAQIEAQFAEEEFFVAVQVAFLALFSLLLILIQVFARRLSRAPQAGGFKLRPLWGMLSLFLLSVGLVWWGARAYQASFYSSTVPDYGEVSVAAPFLCASLPSDRGAPEGVPEGGQIFQRIQALVERNPHKGVPEYGMLALNTGQRRWAEAFRHAILVEAEAALFTEPANSVKYGQRLAALRAYYLPRVRDAFPGLFSDDELATLKAWFAAVNRRALTVEWVDFLYGLAFSFWPEGPYENQENGAGLLALLESSGLGDSELSAANRDYLARNVRGWGQRFRNTDDAYLYQPEWIDNALFQQIYEKRYPDLAAYERNQQLSFEWLLLQALPGGVPMTYNRPGALPVVNTLYLGALLLDDARYLWAADQALRVLEDSGGYLFAQPGLERPAALTGTGPSQGSCLLFSPSGLPTQVGPLAPDKIIFRDGWTAEATYLLLNLRFTGWHRYKGTNGVVLLYKNGPVVLEDSAGEDFGWLPTGRSLFRDKRIPRENLNGLLISRSGFGQVVYAMSGLNGPWAQDPPHHARVEGFYGLGLLDASRTTLEDWRGWRHQRSIFFFHQGPVLVIDSARHPKGGQSALSWHLGGSAEKTEAGIWLRRGDTPVRVTLPSDTWSQTTLNGVDGQGAESVWKLTYHSPHSGRLDLVTAFLMNDWAEAAFEAQPVLKAGEQVGQLVYIGAGIDNIRLLYNTLWQAQKVDPVQSKASASSGVISAAELSTDGLALVVIDGPSGSPHTVCAMGGTRASLALAAEPRSVRPRDSQEPLQRGRDWEWRDGLLTLWTRSTDGLCLGIEH